MADALKSIRTRHAATPQSEQADPAQVKNSAGGFSFTLSELARARRFLILGADGGSYYATERKLTVDNAKVIMWLANSSDGRDLVKLIREVSVTGAAPRQQPTLFALAICAASERYEVRYAALQAIPVVCRTGTMLFTFLGYVEQFRGWGRGLRDAVAQWYLTPSVENVAFQAVKYRQREGWTHRDVLRLAHPKAPHLEGPQGRQALFDWICGRATEVDIPIVQGYNQAQYVTNAGGWIDAIETYKLPWEALPDAALGEPRVWEALLPHMGMTAMIRNLGRLTHLGTLRPMNPNVDVVVKALTDQERVRKARIHPLKVLDALITYRGGHGLRGKLSWGPIAQVSDALERCFYLSFGAITPANKRTMLALDVSSSMGWGNCAGSSLNPAQAAAAMAMVMARTEPRYMITAFAHNMVPLPITASHSLNDVIGITGSMTFGGTDCSLPMIHAARERLEVDTFITLTDSETWAGRIHPHEALDGYRRLSGINARAITVGMVGNEFTLADPSDAGQLDVVGFDTTAPELMTAFSRREF